MADLCATTNRFSEFSTIRQRPAWQYDLLHISSIDSGGHEMQHSVPKSNACTHSVGSVSGKSTKKKEKCDPNERTRTNVEYLNFFNGF